MDYCYCHFMRVRNPLFFTMNDKKESFMNKVKEVCKHKRFHVICKDETYPVLGEDITINARVKICDDCGAEVLDYELDNDNLNKAFRAYKRKHALLSAEEICALRKKYGISQRTLATLIGCSQATIVRYENGNIQDNTHNNIMRMLQRPENMAELLEIKEEELSQKEVQTIRNALSNLETACGDGVGLISNMGSYMHIKADQFSGFKEFDFSKFTDMVRFFSQKLEGKLYKTKLFKLLWYADMYYFRKFTKSISGMNYVHFPYGPVPREYSFLLGIMEKSGAISITDVENQYGYGEVIETGKEYALPNSLNADESDVLEMVLDEFGNLSAGEISERSHGEKGYTETRNNEMISYMYALDMVKTL